jgi:hypothetical protein
MNIPPIPAQPKTPTREVLCEDAVAWLRSSGPLSGSSVVSSLPDISEFSGHTVDQWTSWFVDTARLLLQSTPDEGVTVFYQSDIKCDGIWIDKGYLCQKAAEGTGHHLVWHKIGCRAPAGTPTHGRCGYSHLLCFSRTVQAEHSTASADVLPTVGEKSWERGMGQAAAQCIASFIATHTQSHTIINPFCGQGMMLAAANAAGLHSIGIERSPKRADQARVARF